MKLHKISEIHEVGVKGRGVRVAVLDSGIDPTHEVFSDAKIVKEATSYTRDWRDRFGHGTSVSGIVHKVAPEAEIVSIKVLDDEGYGSLASVLEGIEKAVSHGCHVINMSLGGFPALISPLCTVLLVIEPITVAVCAAGNSGPKPYTVSNPAHCSAAIAVGSASAIYKIGDPAWFSSRGPAPTGIVKPDVMSFGGYGDLKGIHQPIERIILPSIEGRNAEARGTSFASPFIAGSMALAIQFLGRIPSRGEIEYALDIMSYDVGRPGKDNDTGYGVFQANRVRLLPRKPRLLELLRKAFIY